MNDFCMPGCPKLGFFLSKLGPSRTSNIGAEQPALQRMRTKANAWASHSPRRPALGSPVRLTAAK
jgi:hypothetical protein